MPTKRIKRPDHGPEWFIRRDLITYLEVRGWHVEIMIGNAYQFGIPDLYCFHRKWGERWIDVKNPKKYAFTRPQKAKWPEWERAGIGIWILVAATQEEYDKLFQPPNWRKYVKKNWKIPSQDEIDKMLDNLK